MTVPTTAPLAQPATPLRQSGLSGLPPRPHHAWRTVGIVVALGAFTTLTLMPAIGGIQLDFTALVRNWSNSLPTIRQLLRPDFAFLPRTIAPMAETLEMAVAGAAFAAIVSIPITLWAARPSNPNPFTRQLVRFIININRAVPDLVFAIVLVAMLGVGALPGFVTLFLFDLGVVVKLVSEAIDSSDHDYIEAGRAAGGTQTQINRVTVLPQSWTLYANQWLYSLELNVRISAILGIVGAGGIGRLLDERRGFYAYNDVSIIILEILVAVIVIEFASNALRKKLR
ncbi:MAG: phosphonate ABC transporter, permease protein PhnE [Nakamurella sp.]